MARYKPFDRSPRLLPVDLDAQRVPGTYAHAQHHLLDEIDLSAFDAYNVRRGAQEASPRTHAFFPVLPGVGVERSSCRTAYWNPRDFGARCILGTLKFVARLEIEPALRIGSEVACKAKGGIGRDAAPAPHDLVDSRSRHAQHLRQRIAGQAERLHEFFEQDLAWVDGGQFAGHGQDLSVIVDDLDVFGIRASPSKTKTPRVVDADAVLSLAVPAQRFKAIAGRHTQEVDGRRCMQQFQLAPCDLFDVAPSPGWTTIEKHLSVLATKAPDRHGLSYIDKHVRARGGYDVTAFLQETRPENSCRRLPSLAEQSKV